MTRTARIGTVACVLAAVILIAGGTFVASADTRRKIVSFRPIDSKDPLCLLGFCLDLKTELGYLTAHSLVTANGSLEVHNLWLVNALAVELPAENITEALSSLVNSLYVVQVVDDLLTLVNPVCPVLAPLPCVPESYPWGQQQIEVRAVHQPPPAPNLQGLGVTVAIVDTGIDLAHSEFIGRIDPVDPGYNALPGGELLLPVDDHGHGTHMAGIIAAGLNNVGIIGAAPKATLKAVKVLDQNGAGRVSDVINGLQWVYNSDIRLVNMSLGFPSDSTPLRQATKALYNSGVIIVASAGNRCAVEPTQDDGAGECKGGPAAACTAPLTAVTYPAAYSWVIAVAATDKNDHITNYSLPGTQVDVAAPGGAQGSGLLCIGDILSSERILSTNKFGGYGLGYGTSQAAAHVTGAVALALQRQPGLSFAQVSNLLKTTAVDLGYPPNQQGEGRIDAEKMIEALP
jgi:subtilisin family serine protease